MVIFNACFGISKQGTAIWRLDLPWQHQSFSASLTPSHCAHVESGVRTQTPKRTVLYWTHAFSFNSEPIRTMEYLLMLDRSSLISRVRWSLFFICCSCILFNIRAIKVLRGIEKTMIATPTKADHPRRLYKDTNANVIYNISSIYFMVYLLIVYRTWRGPEIAMRP